MEQSKEEVIKLLKWMAEKDYVWIKKYPNGDILWQKRCADDSMDVWSLPMYSNEQLCEQYIKEQ